MQNINKTPNTIRSVVTWGMIGGSDCKKSRKTFGGDGYIIDYSGGYMAKYIWQDIANYTF